LYGGIRTFEGKPYFLSLEYAGAAGAELEAFYLVPGYFVAVFARAGCLVVVFFA
jgi:hypothetical protein